MEKTITIHSELAELPKIRNFLRKNLKNVSLSEEVYYSFELALVEICINIIRYAFPQEKGHIHVKIWIQDRTIFLEIRDKGIAFDPTKAKRPVLQDIMRNEQKGGLGIFLSRKLMDGFKYRRENAQNILTINKSI